MKKVCCFLIIGLLAGCSSTRLVDSWKNPQTINFNPEKLLVVGMTKYTGARSVFEQDLEDELTFRGINAVKSLSVFDPAFTHAKQTEQDIDALVKILNEKGFDAVLVTAVRGVENKKVTRGSYYISPFAPRRFRNYYFLHQDIYYYPEYYEDYKVYHLETSLFNIKPDSERSLIWIGYIDIVDPSSMEGSINDYVKEIIRSMEKEKIIRKL
ncbi:MAG: hypothetical protein KDC69_03365 [Flavobacteriaceae bacterium]|nr:hypothetical protein [Flavobacteriaceae bacterium]